MYLRKLYGVLGLSDAAQPDYNRKCELLVQ